jgi:hypothetical protein
MMTTRLVAASACCIALALPALAGPGCMDKTQSCTEVGCIDQATVELRTTTGAWVSGTYELTIDLGGAMASCALAVPDSPSATGVVSAACTSRLTLDFAADTQCQAGPSTGSGPNSAVSETCTPVPGHFHQTLTVPGTPANVALTLTRDGHSLLDTSVALTYQTAQPNGPACDPTCHQAAAQLSVPAETGDAGAESGTPAADAGAE